MTITARTPPSLLTLILISAVSMIPVNMFLPSLSNIAAEFGVKYSLVTLSITGFAAVAAGMQLILGPLSDRFGRRPVLLTGFMIFILASLGCALAADIWTFLFFRLLQGAAIAGYAVSLAVIRDSSGERDATSLIGYVTTAWALAPMLGPAFGGALDDLFGWRASFWALAGFGLAAFVLCWVDLGETNARPSETLGAQLRGYPELLRARRYWGYTLCMTFSTGAFYAFLAGAPLAAETMFGTGPSALGFYMGTTTAGFMLGSFLAGRYAARLPPNTMLIAGRVVASAALVAGLGLFAAGAAHVMALFGPCVLVGIGNGMTIPNANAGALSVRRRLAGSAAGLAGALTIAGGGAISALTGAVITSANSAYALMGVMLLSSVLALIAALYVIWLDRRAARWRVA